MTTLALARAANAWPFRTELPPPAADAVVQRHQVDHLRARCCLTSRTTWTRGDMEQLDEHPRRQPPTPASVGRKATVEQHEHDQGNGTTPSRRVITRPSSCAASRDRPKGPIPGRCRGCSAASTTAGRTARGFGPRPGGCQVAIGHRRLSIIDVAGGNPADEERRRRRRHQLQRRDLQFRAAARRAGGQGSPVPDAQRHRGDPPHFSSGVDGIAGSTACSRSRSGTRAQRLTLRATAPASSRSTTRSCRRRHRVRVRADGAARPRRGRPRAVDRRPRVVLLLDYVHRATIVRERASWPPATASSGRTATSGCPTRTGRCRRRCPRLTSPTRAGGRLWSTSGGS